LQSDTGNTGPLVIVTTLFFMWGLLTALNDVPIPHLKALYTLRYVQAMLVQFCFFGAYFAVSLPAGMLIKKIGYQNGAVAGLTLTQAFNSLGATVQGPYLLPAACYGFIPYTAQARPDGCSPH
jgi:fucose permease